MEPQHETYLTPEEVSARYGGKPSTRTLANWRSSGSGTLPYVKLGGRVVYPLSRVVEWEQSRTATSTADFKR